MGINRTRTQGEACHRPDHRTSEALPRRWRGRRPAKGNGEDYFGSPANTDSSLCEERQLTTNG